MTTNIQLFFNARQSQASAFLPHSYTSEVRSLRKISIIPVIHIQQETIIFVVGSQSLACGVACQAVLLYRRGEPLFEIITTRLSDIVIMNNFKLSNRVCPEGMTIEEWQVALRREAAVHGRFRVQHLDDNRIWGDYLVQHDESRYKVAFRGIQSDRNYCSCLDFRTSGLGTCKHIEAVTHYLQETEPGYPWDNEIYEAPYTCIYISYKGGRTVRLCIASGEEELFAEFKNHYFGSDNILPRDQYRFIDQIVDEGQHLSSSFSCFEDVYELVDSMTSIDRWKERVEQDFPEGVFDTEFASQSGSRRLLREMYRIIHTGHGVIVGEMTTTLRKEMLGIIEYILQHEEGPALIIAANTRHVDLWNQMINRSPLSSLDALYVVSQEQFSVSQRLPSGLFSCVLIENGDLLKEWNNIVSKTIKKLSIKHLYIQLPTIQKLTPVQYSSVVQHISPYLLAPFYRFIRDVRPLFPLLDSGENMPPVAEAFMFTRSETQHINWDEMRLSAALDTDKNTPAGKVVQFLSAMRTMLQDEEARELFLAQLDRLQSGEEVGEN